MFEQQNPKLCLNILDYCPLNDTLSPTDNGKQTNVIEINDISGDIIEEMLRYIYYNHIKYLLLKGIGCILCR
ncbi:unnamed protein product [Didymodactylos carnosus]|uniref:Uncharacterized protein n=1 Tax=Didymodactylos carnosus TaxID=1234261 RepID=A0A8S2GI16_9BILA|nr:unnamed protein product [Didymodactylos carnosus]CAF3497260.1 unnamed protein product [Didymodactylos carnosus]